MQYVIENIRPYTAAEAGAKYMVCMSNLMPMLVYHNRLFDQLQAFNLLRAGWSFCFSPGTGQIRAAYMMHRFLGNLQRFFSASVEAIPCPNAPALRHLLVHRICAGRPLFAYVQGVGNPVQQEGELAMPKGEGHLTFVAFGVDTATDRVLLTNDYQRTTGWAPIEYIAPRLHKRSVYDIHLSPDCHLPSPEVVRRVLAEKIHAYLHPMPCVYRLLLRCLPEKWRQSHRELLPSGAISGPEGIVKFAAEVARWAPADQAEKAARRACRHLMGLQQERGIFLALLTDMAGAAGGDMERAYTRGRALEEQWRAAAKWCSRVYMGKSRNAVPELAIALRAIADEEKSAVSSMRTVLDNAAAR